MTAGPATGADFVRGLRQPPTRAVHLSLLGVDTEHRVDDFKQWSLSRSLMTWGNLTEQEQVPHARHLVDYWDACQELVAQAHATSPDSLVGDLVRAQETTPDNALTDHEIASVCYSLLFAGHETTTTLPRNAARMLLYTTATSGTGWWPTRRWPTARSRRCCGPAPHRRLATVGHPRRRGRRHADPGGRRAAPR